MWSVFLILFFVSLHFFFIELKDYWAWYLAFIILISSLLLSFFLWYDDLFKISSLFVIHIWFAILILSVDNEVNNRKTLSSWAIFNSWVGLFSVFVALTYSLAFISKYDEFNLTCDQINENMDLFVDWVSAPLQLPAQEADQLKDSISWFYNKQFGELIWLPWTWSDDLDWLTWDLQSLTWDVQDSDLQSFTWDLEELDIQESDLEGMTEDEVLEAIQWEAYTWWLLWTIDSWKNQFVDNVMQDREIVDQWVCEVFIDQISERYDQPWFRASVIVLLFLLLWPSFRFVFFVIWILSFIFFKILNLLKIYQFELQTDEVENIK